MYFTLLFHSGPEQAHLAYDLVYHPTPIWCKNGEWLVNNGGQYYNVGYLESLLKEEHKLFGKLYQYQDASKKVRIICHNGGHGRQECLQNIIQDLTNHDFSPEVLSNSNDA